MKLLVVIARREKWRRAGGRTHREASFSAHRALACAQAS
jgi:hypothetical protein